MRDERLTLSHGLVLLDRGAQEYLWTIGARMTTDQMRYDLLAQDALRGVVRSALRHAADEGLPGDHHFYISFDTTFDGVQISPTLKSQYPQEMTIVLQHQFWGLEVSDDEFRVGLKFNKVPEMLVVPFAAVSGFFDPSVQFGLQFNLEGDTDTKMSSQPLELGADHPLQQTLDSDGADEATESEEKATTGEVVSLDAFRKK